MFLGFPQSICCLQFPLYLHCVILNVILNLPYSAVLVWTPGLCSSINAAFMRATYAPLTCKTLTMLVGGWEIYGVNCGGDTP